jgi:hypothetical protein
MVSGADDRPSASVAWIVILAAAADAVGVNDSTLLLASPTASAPLASAPEGVPALASVKVLLSGSTKMAGQRRSSVCGAGAAGAAGGRAGG